jgi:hypothetical protein
MVLAPRPALSDAAKTHILATLKMQHNKLMCDDSRAVTREVTSLECSMLTHGDSFCFVNSLFADPKAFASTQVCLKEVSPVKFRSVVQVKRDGDGRATQSVTMKGPEYKFVTGVERPPEWRQLLLVHASIVLFHVYCKAVYGHRDMRVPLSLPPVPSVNSFVRAKYREPADLGRLFAPSPAPATPGTTPTSWCFVCWETNACDVLFPCRVPSHACCRQCAMKLYERWSSTEVGGEVTVRCPTCSCASGPLMLSSGGVLTLPSKRYELRKQKKPSYTRVRVIRL